MNSSNAHTHIPTRTIGPLLLEGQTVSGLVSVPLATYETPLWPSTARGARVSRSCGGIRTRVIREHMTRSVILEAQDGCHAVAVWQKIQTLTTQLSEETSKTSRFCTFQSIHGDIVGPLLYVRFAFSTGDASGHNMVTQASQHLMDFLITHFDGALSYVSISGNVCADKKVSAINGILGRGREVLAEINIPRAVCMRLLKTTPEALVSCVIKKNLMGSILAGSIRSANAHVANMLLAFYLATGQDGANVVEGSQAITFAEERNGDLYFSLTLPNLIVGTCGNGKNQDFIKRRLKNLGCLPEQHHKPGQSARRLAEIAAGAVLCGELSLLAALTNSGELMESHIRLERTQQRAQP